MADPRKQALSALMGASGGPSPRARYLMQSTEDPTRWEALDYRADEPHQFERRTLDTAQAAQWQRDGGFEILTPLRFDDELRKVSDATTANRKGMADYEARRAAEATDSVMVRDPMTTDVTRVLRSKVPEGAQVLDDRTGATLQRWREEELAGDDAAYEAARKADGARILAGLEGGRRPFRGPSEEMLADLDAQQGRFQQSLRLAGQPSPARGGGVRRPAVEVAKAGAAEPMRSMQPVAMRGPANDQEGRSINAAGRDTTSKGPGDDEFAAAQAEADNRRLAVALGRAGAQVGQAISGVGYDDAAYDALAQEAESPVRRLLAQREADRKKALEDPTSEQSKRVQAAVAKAMPGVYTPEELAGITAADADMVTQYGAMRQRIEERKADIARQDALRAAAETREDRLRADDRTFQTQQAAASRTFQAGESAKGRAFQREMAGLNNAAELERARVTAQNRPGMMGIVIPGLEVAPGAAPTTADATAVKKSEAARKRLNALASELKDLHAKHGTELVGPAARRMEQLTTAMELEAKTIGELGALTGPDLDLVRSLTQVNPTSLGANLKALVGLDGTQEALSGVEDWANNMANANREAYGYQPRSGQPAPSPQTQGDMVPMLDPQGRRRMVPRARVQDAIAAGGRLVNG
jgi:hypothetical protein